MGVALNVHITLGNMAILSMLILPFQNTDFSISISFNNALYFSVYKSFTSFVKFICRCFILFFFFQLQEKLFYL